MDIKRFTFRLPANLFAAVESIAQANHRSVNAEVIVAIEAYLKSLKVSPQSDDDQTMETKA